MFLYARRLFVLFELGVCRFGFADADRRLMSASEPVDNTSGNNKDRRLVGDVRSERVDLETMFAAAASKKSVGKLACRRVFHMIHRIILSTPSSEFAKKKYIDFLCVLCELCVKLTSSHHERAVSHKARRVRKEEIY